MARSANGIVYAAEILNLEYTRELEHLSRRMAAKNANKRQNSLYCYVILETQEVKDRAAHFAYPAKDESRIVLKKLPYSLIESDRISIRNEILGEGAPIPLELISLVSGLAE